MNTDAILNVGASVDKYDANVVSCNADEPRQQTSPHQSCARNRYVRCRYSSRGVERGIWKRKKAEIGSGMGPVTGTQRERSPAARSRLRLDSERAPAPRCLTWKASRYSSGNVLRMKRSSSGEAPASLRIFATRSFRLIERKRWSIADVSVFSDISSF